MQKRLKAGILVTFGMLSICLITGCADDDTIEEVADVPIEGIVAPLPIEKDDVDYVDIPPVAKAVKVDPDPRLPILSNTQFALSFDRGVAEAWVNRTPAMGAGLYWTVTPILDLGTVWLQVEWENRDGSLGSMTVGPYTVVAGGRVPVSPVMTGGTVRNGEADVDPVPINGCGFLFDFDKPVTGTIKLTDETCADLNWIGNVQGERATLARVAGQELVNEATYKIEIDVRDDGGSRYRATVTFTTKPR